MTRSTPLIAVTALALFGVSSPIHAEPPKKKKPVPKLKNAIARANQILARMEKADEAARDTIKASKALDGKLEVRIRLKKIDEVEDGSLIIIGTTRTTLGSLDDYTTNKEEHKLAELRKEVEDLAIRKLPPKKEGRRSSESEYSRRKRHRESEEARRKAAEELAEARRHLSLMTQSIKSNARSRKRKCETVQIEVLFTKADRETIDLVALLKRPQFRLLIRVEDFKIGEKPKEIGGGPRIESLKLKGLGVEKKLRASPTSTKA